MWRQGAAAAGLSASLNSISVAIAAGPVRGQPSWNAACRCRECGSGALDGDQPEFGKLVQDAREVFLGQVEAGGDDALLVGRVTTRFLLCSVVGRSRSR